jgi:hypothetical protein
MTRNVNDIIKALPAGRRKRIERRGATLIAEEMTLKELRLNQKQISQVAKR